MAEVKTYKCDICGEVYHVKEDDRNFIKIIHSKQAEEDEVEVTHYDHVCPYCGGEVVRFLDDPAIINNLMIEKGDAENFIRILEDIIKTLSDKICGYRWWHTFYSKSNIHDYCKEMSDDIEFKFKRTRKACYIWKFVALTFIGVYIGTLISTIK